MRTPAQPRYRECELLEPLERRLLLAAPSLAAPVALTAGGAPISVEWDSAVCVADWNADGKKDVLVGQYMNGKVWLFLNQGSDASPALAAGAFVRSKGADITTSYG